MQCQSCKGLFTPNDPAQKSCENCEAQIVSQFRDDFSKLVGQYLSQGTMTKERLCPADQAQLFSYSTKDLCDELHKRSGNLIILRESDGRDGESVDVDFLFYGSTSARLGLLSHALLRTVIVAVRDIISGL